MFGELATRCLPPEQVSQRHPDVGQLLNLPDDEDLRISHEAIPQALSSRAGAR